MIFPTLDELEKSVEAGERYFQTADDPSQSEATVENCQKIIAVDPHAFIIERVDGQLAAYSSVLPTSNAVKNDFLMGKITERELLAIATSEPAFETLYLLVFFVLPEYEIEKNKNIESGISKLSNNATGPMGPTVVPASVKIKSKSFKFPSAGNPMSTKV